jgi:hypothetical protein
MPIVRGLLIMNLDELVRKISAKQKTILDEIWNYYVRKDSWIPAVALYQKFGKDSVLSNIKPLGGSIVYVSRNAGERERFVVTFLGSLLTTNGSALALMFLQYLNYIRERLESDYELKEIDGAQVRERLQFDSADNKLFVKALRLSQFLNGGTFGENTWTVGLPADVDDLFSGVEIQEYFESKALKNYDPSAPTEGERRAIYFNAKARDVFPQSDSFSLPNEDITEGASRQPYDVFLSYASADSKEASQLYDSIVSAGGTAFLSEKALKAGDDFEETIRTALHASGELWLLLSPNSLRSEWVISEWGAAWALRKPIIPILFRCAPAEVPIEFAGYTAQISISALSLSKIDFHGRIPLRNPSHLLR